MIQCSTVPWLQSAQLRSLAHETTFVIDLPFLCFYSVPFLLNDQQNLYVYKPTAVAMAVPEHQDMVL